MFIINTRRRDSQKLKWSLNLTRSHWAYAVTVGLEALEILDLRLAKLSLRRSLCSFNLEASSFWYSAASDFALEILFFLSAILARFLWRVKGVTKRWIFGALLTFFPVTNHPLHIKSQSQILFNKLDIKAE